MKKKQIKYRNKKYTKNMDPKEKEREESKMENETLEDCLNDVKADESVADANKESDNSTIATEGAEAGNETSEMDELQAKFDKVNEELEAYKDKYLRLAAEFDNFRKRTIKEKAELILNGSEKTLTNILPILDDFERAIQNTQTATDLDAVKEGIQLVYNKFMKILNQNGVKMIEVQGKPLDTDFHEAIAMIDAPTEDLKGKIVDCVMNGYTLNDKVIRHAKVVVGK